MKVKERVLSLGDELIRLRQDFHKHPELGREEFRTAEKVERYLEDLGLKVRRMVGTGVVGLLEGHNPGPVLMLRADMDALPVAEKTSVPYRSVDQGKMHACGHDGHMAMLLVAAKILSEYKENINGSIKFVFQPDEENACAKEMVEEGVLNDPDVDAAMGIHLMSGLETGKIGISEGPVMAEANVFRLTVTGKGGHTAMPYKSVDPIVTASAIVQSVQTIQAREIDSLKPTAIVFGKIQGGSFPNIIPESVELEGTIRCLYDSRKDENETLCEKFERIVKGVCATHRSEYNLEFTFISPAVVNDSGMAKLVEKSAQKVVSDNQQIERYVTMIGEDFCEFVQNIPGAFYFIGVGDKDKGTDFPHHHPYFNIDENALSVGVEMHVRSALSYFRNTAEELSAATVSEKM